MACSMEDFIFSNRRFCMKGERGLLGAGSFSRGTMVLNLVGEGLGREFWTETELWVLSCFRSNDLFLLSGLIMVAYLI